MPCSSARKEFTQRRLRRSNGTWVHANEGVSAARQLARRDLASAFNGSNVHSGAVDRARHRQAIRVELVAQWVAGKPNRPGSAHIENGSATQRHVAVEVHRRR